MLAATPTTNRVLPFRTGGFATLAEGLDYAARGETGCNFYSPRGELEVALSYRELRERALDLAARLPAARLRRGDRVAIVAETTPDFLIFFFACQYAGMIPVPLPLCVNFGGRDAYAGRLHGMLMAAGARAAVGPEDLADALRLAAARTAVALVGTPGEFYALPASAEPLQPLRAHEPCYIQYSSGSTSFPRGVLVTQQAIAANARAIAEDGIALRPGDRCVSWLPLYHDMGLVGCCLTPVLTQITVDYLASASFARRPLVWLKLLSQNRGTVSFAPTFGFELCARRAASSSLDGLDLRHWRVAGIGGEMIRPSALAEFATRFAAAGFDPAAFVPSYGLAEATLAVTFAPLGKGVRVDMVERGDALERGRMAIPATSEAPGTRRTRAFVRCGQPMRGYAVEIRDERNRPLADRRIGRVCIQGPSLMTGYYRNAEATAAVTTVDGWLDTGDLGYLVEGELVVTGRNKDLIIFSGRNIWPQDIEWAVEHVPGVRRNDVAAFAVTGEDDREKVVVVVEVRGGLDADGREALRREIAATVHRVAGIDAEIVLAPPRSLHFTTSGKLSRAAARQSYLEGGIRDLGEAGASRPPTSSLEPPRLAAVG